MRLKSFFLFLAIQLVSFAIWQAFFRTPVAPVIADASSVATPVIHSVAENPNINPIFAVRHFSDTQVHINTSHKERIKQVLSKLPSKHTETIEDIVLDYSITAGRGLGGNNTVILRGVNISTKEMISVFIHETAHNVDYGFLSPAKEELKSNFKDGSYTLYITDPSIDFYRINWENENTLKKHSSNLDFVSGYAMNDPFEDFAETYTYYVLHNKDFKALTSTSPRLYAKYRFMKYRVFNGLEFDTGDDEVKMNNRVWDITLLEYDLANFLS